MTVPTWDGKNDTIALESRCLRLAQSLQHDLQEMKEITRIVNDNDITFDGLPPDSEIQGPTPKEAIWQIIAYGEQFNKMWTNQALTAQSHWGGVMGRITKAT